MNRRDRERENDRPFEEDEVEIVVVFGQHVADDACRVTRADLVARQDEVDTLGEVPQLGRHVVSERPIHHHTQRQYMVCGRNDVAESGLIAQQNEVGTLEAGSIH